MQAKHIIQKWSTAKINSAVYYAKLVNRKIISAYRIHSNGH